MKYILIISGLVAGCLAGPSAAQDGLDFSARHTRSCLQEATTQAERQSCIGASAEVCMETSPGGYSTYGMGGCLSLEAEWWDGKLNVSYQSLRKREREDDAFNASEGITAPNKADALRDMQRAWIGFRDAVCAYEYSQWGGGTGGGPANISCVMRMTGEQTLYLESGFGEY